MKLLRKLATGLTLLGCMLLPALPALADPNYQGMTYGLTGTINSVTTTMVINHTSVPGGQRIYLYMAAWMSTGANSANTIQPVYGVTTTTPCDTNPHTMFGAPITAPTATGQWLALWGHGYGNGVSSNVGMPAPAAVAYPIPLGNDYCVTTAGTTTVGMVNFLYTYGP